MFRGIRQRIKPCVDRNHAGFIDEAACQMIAPFIEQVGKIKVEKARPSEASIHELLDDPDGRVRIPRKRNLNRVPDRRKKGRKRYSQLRGQAGQRLAVQHSHRTVY